MSATSEAIARLLTYAQSCAKNETSAYKSDPPERSTLFGVRDALFNGPRKTPGAKKRRRLEETPVNRPCSPTLFLGGSASANTTAKRVELSEQLESTLGNSVTLNYSRPSSTDHIDSGTRLVPAHRYTSLGYTLLPIRRRSPLETWTSHDVAIFEGAICMHGKKFDVIQSLLPHKTSKDIIEFYYVWKNTSHKPVWKKTFKPVELE